MLIIGHLKNTVSFFFNKEEARKCVDEFTRLPVSFITCWWFPFFCRDTDWIVAPDEALDSQTQKRLRHNRKRCFVDETKPVLINLWSWMTEYKGSLYTILYLWKMRWQETNGLSLSLSVHIIYDFFSLFPCLLFLLMKRDERMRRWSREVKAMMDDASSQWLLASSLFFAVFSLVSSCVFCSLFFSCYK